MSKLPLHAMCSLFSSWILSLSIISYPSLLAPWRILLPEVDHPGPVQLLELFSIWRFWIHGDLLPFDPLATLAVSDGYRSSHVWRCSRGLLGRRQGAVAANVPRVLAGSTLLLGQHPVPLPVQLRLQHDHPVVAAANSLGEEEDGEEGEEGQALHCEGSTGHCWGCVTLQP